ncbi:hypothetical protein [Streptomyces sp. KL118A]|uniref:hypothetical protein n=1 Tax=Streptomyces sp. KL118A TaxID=3045153 RepID=UPI00278C4BA0|nr:hypothetical protein [Streptomyces sp. KL118A]
MHTAEVDGTVGAEVGPAALPDVPIVPDFWFELPPGFTEFDLTEDPEARMLRMAEAVDPLFADATPLQKFSMVLSGEYALQTMIAAGAEHVSACLLRMPDGGLSQGTLSVLVERPETGPEHQDRQGSARRTAVQWHEQHPDAEVAVIMLPYGPSALCIRDQDLQLPGVLFGLDDPIPATLRQVQVCVPLKSGPGSVLFVFMTEQLGYWDEYLKILGDIMKSVSADEPGRAGRPETHSGPVPGGAERQA